MASGWDSANTGKMLLFQKNNNHDGVLLVFTHARTHILRTCIRMYSFIYAYTQMGELQGCALRGVGSSRTRQGGAAVWLWRQV
jgi:hypothetical protein